MGSIPPISSAAPPIPKPSGINAVPYPIRFEILKGLGANDLCNMTSCDKSWQKLNDNKPLWTQLAQKLRIRNVDPEKAKTEVIEYWKALPAINQRFEASPVSVKQKGDPFEQNLEWQSAIKENLSKYTDATKKMISELNQKLVNGLTLTKAEILSLQMALDLGITPFQTNETAFWDIADAYDSAFPDASNCLPIIYHLDNPIGFEIAWSEPRFYIGLYDIDHYVNLLGGAISHCNIAFIKFLLARLDKVPTKEETPIDWAEIYIKSWFGVFKAGLDPANPLIKSLFPLFDKYKTLGPQKKYKLYAQLNVTHQFLKNIDMANINRGLAFLREHFLPAKK